MKATSLALISTVATPEVVVGDDGVEVAGRVGQSRPVAHVHDAGVRLRPVGPRLDVDADGERAGPHRVVRAASAAATAACALLPDRPTTAFECTIAVDDVDVVFAAVKTGGGRALMDKTTIAGVGDLVFFADPSGNVCGALRYEPGAD
jgi:hypothetical protein